MTSPNFTVNLRKAESGITNGVYTATLVYLVQSDVATTVEAARTAPGVPLIGDEIDWDEWALCISIKGAMIDNDLTTYEVTCEFSTKRDDQQAAIQNPLERAPHYNFSGSLISQPFFRDSSPQPNTWNPINDGPWTGKPVVNSAGDDFQDLPDRQSSQGTLTIQVNRATFTDWIYEQYKNTTNANDITIMSTTYPAGTLLMGNISAEGPSSENGFTYFAISFEIRKNVAGWNLNLEDRGLNELDSDGNPKPILDATNQPVTTPYPLDGNGTAQDEASDQPAVLEFMPYASVDWSPLSLL